MRKRKSNRRRRSEKASFGFDVLESRKLMTATGLESADLTSLQEVHPIQEVASQESGQQQQQELTQRIVNGQQTSDFPAVGFVGPLGCTGTLISPTHVLTAAHCLEGVGDNQASFMVGGQTINSSNVTIHPGYNANDFGAGNDIAIIELSRPATGIAPMAINRGVPTVGSTLTLVGFGEGGTSQGGFDPNDTGKQVGFTELEEVTQHHISWTFDSHSESNTAPGDSGGPAFIQSGGQQLIAGVTSGGSGDAHTLGDNSFDTRVDVHADWIDSIVGSDPGDPGDPGEPGDDHANQPGASATLIRMDGNQGSATGVLEEAGDRDAFMFVVGNSGESTISLSETDGNLDTYLRLYDANGDLIAENDDSGGTFNSELVESLAAGTYFVTAGGYADGETGNYQVNIAHQPDDVGSGGDYHSFTNNNRKPIDDNEPDRVWTAIKVAGVEGRITDVSVQVDVEHTWVSDLRLVLVSPEGTRIQLVNRLGGSGDNFSNTVFDQQADQHIREGQAPFEGSFQSRKDLGLLNGENPNGRWHLLVIDFEYGDGGALNSWTLEFTTDDSRKKSADGVASDQFASELLRTDITQSDSPANSVDQVLDAYVAGQGLAGQQELVASAGMMDDSRQGQDQGDNQSEWIISAAMADYFAARDNFSW